jgi:hypothetical protein
VSGRSAYTLKTELTVPFKRPGCGDAPANARRRRPGRCRSRRIRAQDEPYARENGQALKKALKDAGLKTKKPSLLGPSIG